MTPPFYGNGPSGVTPPALSRWRDRFIHALLPAPCLGCGTPLPWSGTELGLCARCRGQLRRPAAACAVCALPLSGALPEGWCCAACREHPPAFDRLLALWSYEAPLDAVIQALKFRRLDYLGRHLGEALAARWEEELAGADLVDLVVPVPLHWRRWLSRGYNQAERIARPIASRMGLPLLPALARRRVTPPQTSLGREERKANLRGAFQVRRAARIRGRRIVLIDDVATTGATLEAAAAVLKENGAAAVLAAVAGRTPRGL
ncbi:MAG TPA: ComF family protein [Thermoanaerobaculia bacterium]|nr:ComF family protein [Thermoanaerobaculia bacterium]